MTRSILRDTNGISFAFAVIALFMLFCVGVYIFTLPFINALITLFNGMVSDGMVSETTFGSFNFGVKIYRAIPVFALIGSFIFGIGIALRKRKLAMEG